MHDESASPPPIDVSVWGSAGPHPRGGGVITEVVRTRGYAIFGGVLFVLGGIVSLIDSAVTLTGLGTGTLIESDTLARSRAGAALEAVVGIISAVVSLVCGCWLGAFGGRAGALARSRTPQRLEHALAAQKSYWKTYALGAAALAVANGAALLVAILV